MEQGNEKAPRKNRGAGGSLVARHVRHAYGHEKAPAVLMTVGADARGLLDDLHVGADAFRPRGADTAARTALRRSP